MSVLDPKRLSLWKNGRPVDGFRVTGRVVELALKTSLQTGIRGLRPSDLPGAIRLKLDSRRGNPLVQVHPEDRDAAVHVARHVREKLHTAGWSLVNAVQEEEGGDGEHDLILDKVGDEEGPRGLVSGELKCRRLWSDAGQLVVRKALRKEQVEECTWWRAALARRTGVWCGRMVVLCVFNRSGVLTASHAEWKPVGGVWATVWGWRGQAVRVPAPPPPQSRVPRALPARRPFPALTYRWEHGRLVAPVAKVLEDLGRSTANVGRETRRFKRRNPGLAEDLFQAPRKAAKKGGPPEWVGTEAALTQLHADA